MDEDPRARAADLSSRPWRAIPSGRGSSTRRRSSTPAAASSSRSSPARSPSRPRRAAATSRATPRSRWRSRRRSDASMPKDNIERAIAKGTGEGADADALEAVFYEGYGPGGVAILVEALTDNRNRTGSDMRHIFSKHGGNLGEPGSVAYLFDKRGLIVVDARALLRGRPAASPSRPARSTSTVDDDVFEVLTEPADLAAVRARARGGRGRAASPPSSATTPRRPSRSRRRAHAGSCASSTRSRTTTTSTRSTRTSTSTRPCWSGSRADPAAHVAPPARGPARAAVVPAAVRRAGAVGHRRPDHAGGAGLRRARAGHGDRSRDHLRRGGAALRAVRRGRRGARRPRGAPRGHARLRRRAGHRAGASRPRSCSRASPRSGCSSSCRRSTAWARRSSRPRSTG